MLSVMDRLVTFYYLYLLNHLMHYYLHYPNDCYFTWIQINKTITWNQHITFVQYKVTKTMLYLIHPSKHIEVLSYVPNYLTLFSFFFIQLLCRTKLSYVVSGDFVISVCSHNSNYTLFYILSWRLGSVSLAASAGTKLKLSYYSLKWSSAYYSLKISPFIILPKHYPYFVVEYLIG